MRQWYVLMDQDNMSRSNIPMQNWYWSDRFRNQVRLFINAIQAILNELVYRSIMLEISLFVI